MEFPQPIEYDLVAYREADFTSPTFIFYQDEAGTTPINFADGWTAKMQVETYEGSDVIVVEGTQANIINLGMDGSVRIEIPHTYLQGATLKAGEYVYDLFLTNTHVSPNTRECYLRGKFKIIQNRTNNN